ncbi:MAG: restriction endonuclease subunit S [Lachnospiraceae bacterium]|nr:restriction endonuclease subunit S [Lachnospiraceae bacterium]
MEIEVGKLIKKAKVKKCGNEKYSVLSMTMHEGLMFQDDRFKKQIASVDQSSYQVVSRHQLVESFPIDEGVLAVQELADEGIVSPAYKIWDVDTDKVIPKYLEYALRSPRSIEYYKSKLRGTTARRRSIPDADFLSMLIRFPVLEEQSNIVDSIEKVKSIIDLRKKELETVDDLIKARFVELFGSQEYEKKQLIELIQEGAGLSYGIVVPGDNVEDGIPMVRPSDFKNGSLNLDNVYRVASDIECKYKKTRLIGDEILVQVIGQPGQVMLSDERCKGMNVTRNLAVIRIDKNKADRLFISHYLTTEEAQRFMFGSTNQSTLKQLPLNKLKELPVPLVPVNEQVQFADFVKQVDKSKVVVQKALDETQLLFDSLMQKYFG